MKSGYAEMKCGLIGEHLSHSFSPLIHSYLADYSYELKELRREEIGNFMKSSYFDAFNVTIPYKKDVIPFLDEISEEARKIGAVNTVVRCKNGKLKGYNTDYFGFSHMVEKSKIEVFGKKALVLGKGGAALTVLAVLKDMGAKEIISIGRKENCEDFLKNHFDADIIVNATPVGMYPQNGVSPINLSNFKNCSGVFDLIFNPSLTSLLLDAQSRNIPYCNGLSMLVAQAAKAFEFFTGDKSEYGCIDKITGIIENKTKNIILIGMPGCGKSTVGAMIAKKMGRKFLDADVEFEKQHGISTYRCITESGEEKFRELEHLTTVELGKLCSCVIAMGGGVITKDCNYAPLHQNGYIFFIERDLQSLSKEGRPLSLTSTPESLYASRIDAYNRFSDITVYNNASAEELSLEIIEKFNKISLKRE